MNTGLEFQEDMFDADAGKARAEEGMARAGSAFRVERWKVLADDWLMRKVTGTEFTADDLVRSIGLPDEGVNRNNVVGSWFREQRNQRKIVWAGRVKKSERIDRHTGLIRIWTVI
jgi:hypothetical protein